MNLVNVLVLGVVEGLTEFLPISSTFHLILTTKILNITQNDFVKVFEVFIQSGAILAILSLYLKDLRRDSELVKKIIASFLPTAIIGFSFYKIIKGVFFESYYLMLFIFIGVGLIFIIIEEVLRQRSVRVRGYLTSLSWQQAIVVGVVQSLAVIPGVSRAGAVIVVMIFMGFRRDEAAKYSFLLAVPTILAASLFDLFKMREVVFTNLSNIGFLSLGFLTAFIFALISVKWFINFLKKNTLEIFGIYRIILTIVIVILLLGQLVLL